MEKIYSTIMFLFVLFLWGNNSVAQSVNADSTNGGNSFQSDSSFLNLKFNTAIQSNPFYSNYIDSKFLYNQIGNDKGLQKESESILLPLNMLHAFYKQKNNLSQALQLQRKWAAEQNLGFIGKVLGYVNAAAAGYLLYSHFEKYKDEYK